MSNEQNSMPGTQYSEYEFRSGDEIHSNAYLASAINECLRGRRAIGRLLDAGCGNGTLTVGYLQHAREVYAFDMSSSGLAHARQKLGEERVATASAYDDFRTLFAGVDSFDVIVSAEVIEHLYDPRAFIARAREALVPGGSLILTTPYHGYLKNLILAVTGKMDAHFTALWDGGHIKFWSRETLSKLLLDGGFSNVRFRGAGRKPLLWKSMVMMADCT